MNKDKKQNNDELVSQADKPTDQSNAGVKTKTKTKTIAKAKEYGGRKDGLDPTRYGDWEKNGRCIDF